jgi:Uma2 family endonuclease
MSIMINDQVLANELLTQRRTSGGDRYDEVWDGVYVLSPMANREHQGLATEFAAAVTTVIDWRGLGRTLAGANVSDRGEGWAHNYRVPDVLVFLTDTSAQDCGTHWFGGPDFAIEIVSPDDRTLDKLDFYAAVGTRELLVIDRNPWQLTLYRLSSDREPNPKLVPVALSTFAQPATIASETLPLSITLQADPAAICLGHTDGTVIRDIPIKP